MTFHYSWGEFDNKFWYGHFDGYIFITFWYDNTGQFLFSEERNINEQ